MGYTHFLAILTTIGVDTIAGLMLLGAAPPFKRGQ